MVSKDPLSPYGSASASDEGAASPSRQSAKLRNLLRRPPAPAKDRGRLQRQIRRAFLVHGPVVSSSVVYDWAFARRPQQRCSQLHRWSVVRILREIAEPIGRAPTGWLWRLRADTLSALHDSHH
jgi:hypothetical protein